MTKKRAINLILRQKSKIEEYGDDLIWINITLSYFESIFGVASREYALMKSFSHWAAKPHPHDSRAVAEWEDAMDRLGKLLDESIESIRLKGILKGTKSNFFSGKTNGVVWSIIIATVVAIGGGCYLFGIYTSDVKNYDLKQENVKLRESLSKARDSLNRTNAPDNKTKPDTTNHNKAQK